MFWHTCPPCRWILHSSESLPPRGRERWKLAHSSHPLLQQGGFTSQFVCVSETVLISDLTFCVTDVCLISYPLKFLKFCCDHFLLLMHQRISFSAFTPTKQFQLSWSLCVFVALCGRLLFNTLLMHIRHTSPLIFFMFFHFPQPATRYVSMSVCQGTHTPPSIHLFLSFSLPLSFFSHQQSVSEERVCCRSASTPYKYTFSCIYLLLFPVLLTQFPPFSF